MKPKNLSQNISPEDFAPDQLLTESETFDLETVNPMIEDGVAELGLQEAVPPLGGQRGSEAGRVEGIRSFFRRRAAQLSNASKKAVALIDDIFSRNIDGNLSLTGRQALRARLHPAQLRHNFINNTRMFVGKSYGPIRSIENPVIRSVLYGKAAEGNSEVLRYIAKNDTKLGKTEYGAGDAALEAAAILTGAAAVRKVGLYAILGVSMAGAILSKDPAKQRRHIERIDRVVEKDAVEFGTQKFNARKAHYALVAAAARNHVRSDSTYAQGALAKRRDPFEHL